MIEFGFDCSSPWTYLAFHNIQLLAEEFNTQIACCPFFEASLFTKVASVVVALPSLGMVRNRTK